jgi:hypothetical protein
MKKCQLKAVYELTFLCSYDMINESYFEVEVVKCTIYGIPGTAAESAVKAARTVICITWTLFGIRTGLRSTGQKQDLGIHCLKTAAGSIRLKAVR